MRAAKEDAPVPGKNEPPQDYILRLCEYLAEPHRRRLGVTTLNHVRGAVKAMRQPSAKRLKKTP